MSFMFFIQLGSVLVILFFRAKLNESKNHMSVLDLIDGLNGKTIRPIYLCK